MPFRNRWSQLVACWRWLRYDVPLKTLWALTAVAIILLAGLLYGLRLSHAGLVGEVFVLPAAAVTGLLIPCMLWIPLLRNTDRFDQWLRRDGKAQHITITTFMAIVFGVGGYSMWQDRHTPHGKFVLCLFTAMLGFALAATLFAVVATLIRPHRNNTPSQ